MMIGSKPYLTKFSREPRKLSSPNSLNPQNSSIVRPQPRPTIYTEVRNETTDDN